MISTEYIDNLINLDGKICKWTSENDYEYYINLTDIWNINIYSQWGKYPLLKRLSAYLHMVGFMTAFPWLFLLQVLLEHWESDRHMQMKW